MNTTCTRIYEEQFEYNILVHGKTHDYKHTHTHTVLQRVIWGTDL